MEIDDRALKTSPNKTRKAFKTLLIIFLILIIAAIVCVFVILDLIKSDDYSALFIDHADTQPNFADDSSSLDDNAPHVASTVKYNGTTYVKNENVVNILFLGIDTNEERAEQKKGYRSDMVMVCAVDVEAKTATLISIPRDTYTTVYKRDRDTGAVTDIVQQKINAAYAYGRGASHYSYQNATDCVQMFLQRECELETPLDFALDIPVDFYAGIDMDGITEVASAVDGIEVTLDYDIPDVGSKGETVTLTGYKAEMYLTDRHNTANADIGRAARQRTFMLELAKKIKNMGAVDIIVSLSDEMSEFVDFNLNATQMLAFAKVLMGVNIDAIQTHTIAGENGSIDGTYFYMHDEAATLELLLDIYYNEKVN